MIVNTLNQKGVPIYIVDALFFCLFNSLDFKLTNCAQDNVDQSKNSDHNG